MLKSFRIIMISNDEKKMYPPVYQLTPQWLCGNSCTGARDIQPSIMCQGG